MVIFEGDPSGSLSKNGMTVISNWNYNIWARDPQGIPQFLTSTQQINGDMPTVMRIGMNKCHMEY